MRPASDKNPSPSTRSRDRVWDVLGAVLAAFAVTGVVLLFNIIAWAWDLILVGSLLILLVLRWRKPHVARIIGAGLVPLFALLGVDYVWALIDPWRPPALIGLPLAALVVAGAAWVYLESWLVEAPPRHAGRWVLLVVVTLLIAPPLIVLGIRTLTEDANAIPGAKPVSQLDVVVIGANASPRIGATTIPRGWNVSYWSGRMHGDTVSWSDTGPPALRDDADSVLLLLPDGVARPLEDASELGNAGSQAGEVSRWLAIADSVTKPTTPTFALLQTHNPERLAAWKEQLTPGGTSSDGLRHGGVISLQDVAVPQSIGDLAFRLAVTSPTADQDLALAVQYRPALFFDHDEKYSIPLDVDSVLESGLLRLCHDDQPVLALCDEVHGSDDLKNDANHLAFVTNEVASATDDTTIYVHVTRHERMVYLDYWWYFPDNPTYAAGGALCGAGFVIAEVTCFDHQSDWEGVTVVLDSDSGSSSPVAVHYAEHDGTIRYTWPALQRLWTESPTSRFTDAVDTSVRPLVFVALGTHASYPTACEDAHCDEPHVPLEENSHDGGKPWQGNAGADCPTFCVTALPTRAAGTEPARWNAYEGHWGTTECELHFLCSSSDAPNSPGQQGRYRRPWCTNRTVEIEAGQLTSHATECP